MFSKFALLIQSLLVMVVLISSMAKASNLAYITGHQSDSMQSIVKEDLDIERELKLINKAPVKSINTKFGYIVDCIDINKQPAFDHPLLMNHKLQRIPSFQNKIKKTSLKNPSTRAIYGLEKDQCPTGTVPIRRTTKDDLIRGKSFFEKVQLEIPPGSHVAQVTLKRAHTSISSYYGVSGTTSVFSLKVGKDQSSTTMMWVRNGNSNSTNLIGIGWHVAPPLYNDDATHLYTVWTTDTFKKTGCFNLQCSGFVQTSKEYYLGGRFSKTSTYDGDVVETRLSIIQDPATKNWWLTNEIETIGYFPASLFPNLNSADLVGWGGRTTTSIGTPSPPMGSGYFPDKVFNHASSFINITYQDDSRKNFGPDNSLTQTFSDKPNCFRAQYYGDQGGEVGYSLQFGGPGGACGD